MTGNGASPANGSAGAPRTPLSTAMATGRTPDALDTPAAERRRAARVMADRMKQLVAEQMDQADAQEVIASELRRELGETRERLADSEAKAARERAEAQAEAARLRQDLATLQAEASRLARDLSDERERSQALTERLRQVAAIATAKTA